jgi:hypothetical protein
MCKIKIYNGKIDIEIESIACGGLVIGSFRVLAGVSLPFLLTPKLLRYIFQIISRINFYNLSYLRRVPH